jgi:hypothetical protein
MPAHTYRLLGLLILLLILSACTQIHPLATRPSPSNAPLSTDKNLALIQSDVMDFADTYANTLGDAYAIITRNYDNSLAMRRTALSLSLAGERGVFIIATDENPLAGLANMAVLVCLQRRACDTPWFAEALGPSAAPIRTIMTDQEKQVWKLAERYLTSDQTQELRDAIETWSKDHADIRIITTVRLQDIQQARASRNGKPNVPNSVFGLLFIDPFASLDPAVREVQETRIAAARMFYYVQRMPDLIRVQAEALYMDALSAPEITTVVDSSRTFTANTTSFTESCRQFADTIAKFPADLTVEREKTVAQLNDAVTAQRAGAVTQLADATAKERDAAIVQLAAAVDKERQAAIDQVAQATTRERKDTIDQLAKATAKERDAALRQANTVLDQSTRSALADLDTLSDQIINRFTVRLALTAVVSAIAIALVSLAYRFAVARLFPPNIPHRPPASTA